MAIIQTYQLSTIQTMPMISKSFKFFTLISILLQWNCNQNVNENKNPKTIDSIEIKENCLNPSDSTKHLKSLRSYLKPGRNQRYKLYRSIIFNELGLKTSEIIYKPNGKISIKTNFEYGETGNLENETSWEDYPRTGRYIKRRLVYDTKNRISKELFFSDSTSIFETRNYSYHSFDSISKQISKTKDNEVESIDQYFYNKKHQKILETLIDRRLRINHQTAFEYDSFGNLVFKKDSASNSVIYVSYYKYDKANHLIETLNLYRDEGSNGFDTISRIKFTYGMNKLLEAHWVLKDRISIQTYQYSGKYLMMEQETQKDPQTSEFINESQTKYFYEFYDK